MENRGIQALGNHLLVELYNCDPDLIDDLDYVHSILKESAEISGATIIKEVFHKFSPQGVTGVIVISESHFAIHTWPEYGYCSIDIFTCGEKIDSAKALKNMRDKFRSDNISVSEIKRGLLELPVEKLV